MSRKNVLLPYKLLDAQSLAANFNSAAFDIKYLDNVGITLEATTADVSGQFYVQAKIDAGSTASWFDLDVKAQDGTALTITGANKKFIVNLNQVPYAQLRVRFEYSAGSAGTVTAWILVKMI